LSAFVTVCNTVAYYCFVTWANPSRSGRI